MSETFDGQTVEAARRALTVRLQIESDRFRRTRRAASGRRGAGSRSDRPDIGGELRRSRRTKRFVSKISPAAASTANRWRAFSESRNSGGCRCNSSAATLVPRPDTETVVELALDDRARCAQSAIADCASPTRHRLGRHSAGAAVRAAGRLWHRHRHQPSCVANRTQTTRPMSDWRIARRSSPAIMRRHCRALSI